MTSHTQQSNNAQQDGDLVILVDGDKLKNADLEGSALEIGSFNAIDITVKVGSDAPIKVVLQTSKTAQPDTWTDLHTFEWPNSTKELHNELKQVCGGLLAYIRIVAHPHEGAEYTLDVRGQLLTVTDAAFHEPDPAPDSAPPGAA